MGGCVAIKPEREPNSPIPIGPIGLSIHIAAIEECSWISSTYGQADIFLSALAKARGLRVVRAAVASAWYSRARDTAKRNSGAII